MTDSLKLSQALVEAVLDDSRAASDLFVRSDVMAVVAVTASAACWLFAGGFQVRAAAPRISARCSLVAGAGLLSGRRRPRARNGVTTGAVPAELGAAAAQVTLLLLLPVSVIAMVLLVAGGHLPALPADVPPALVGLAVLVAVVGLYLPVRGVLRVPERRRWLAARGPHLAAATVLGEGALVLTSATTAWGLTHTEGTTLSLLEVGLASVAARGLTLSRIPPAGLAVADVAFVIMLLGAGLSPEASMATVAVWRAGFIFTWLVAVIGGVHPTPSDGAVCLPTEPTGSPAGERFHRTAFRLISALPPELAFRVRARVFELLFSLVEDPWRYDVLPYEHQKRRLLVDSIPAAIRDGGPIVELGCADGHNLAALADRFPQTRIIGLDISPVAVAAAAQRTSARPNVTAHRSDARSAAATLRGLGVESVSVLVVAEMLYYLGGPAQIDVELKALAPLLHPSGVLVLVHGESDATRLHGAAVASLSCATKDRVMIADPDRPFVIETAHAVGGP